MTKISNCPHKDVLCLISLTTDFRKKMINNGYDPDDAIKNLKGIGVDVCDLTIQSLSKINQYRLVIIICHHIQSQDIDALVLGDNTLLPVDVFVHAISTEFTGLLDLAICDSKAMAYEIKALSKYPDALRIQFAEDETDVEFRLCYIYPDLLNSFSFNPIDDYKERYREAYLDAIEVAEREQKERVKDINSLLEGTKLGTMTTSAVPLRVYRNSPFPVKVYIHADGEELDINAEIGDYRRNIKRSLKLNNGDPIFWVLSFNTDPKPYENLDKHILGGGYHSETWNGERIEYTFNCFVEPEFCLNGFNGVLKSTIGDKEPQTWSFSFPVEVIPYVYTNDIISNETNNEQFDDRIRPSISLSPSHKLAGTAPKYDPFTYKSENEGKNADNVLTDDLLAEAVKAVQKYMWGASAYAVLFCECRDNRNYQGNMTQYECKIDAISEEYNLTYRCKAGTLSDAFRHNPYMKMHVDKWRVNGAKTRCLLLLQKFQEALP